MVALSCVFVTMAHILSVAHKAATRSQSERMQVSKAGVRAKFEKQRRMLDRQSKIKKSTNSSIALDDDVCC